MRRGGVASAPANFPIPATKTRACRQFSQNGSGGEVNGGKEIASGFVVAGCDCPELFEFTEEILDQVALFERFGRGGITADLPAAANGSRTRRSASKARSAISRLAVICGSSASAPAKSCACPGVSRKRRGLPSASTSAWIFVLRPPRLWPSAWFSTFFESAGAVLMSPHDGAVDHCVFVIVIGCQVPKDALPYAGFGPAAEPPVRILPVAEALRQVVPWYSRTVPVQHR